MSDCPALIRRGFFVRGRMGGMKDSGKVALIMAFVAVLLIPVGYILSSGPALWLLEHDRISSEAWYSIYRPLVNDFGPLGAPIMWYWDLWVPVPSFTLLRDL
jgi:hypothetical protein